MMISGVFESGMLAPNDTHPLSFLPTLGARAVCKILRDGWERFVTDGVVPASIPLRSLALDRWQTARQHGIDPLLERAPLDRSEESGRIVEEDDFALAGRRVLNDMSGALSGAGQALLLADVGGRILYAAGDRTVRDSLYRVNARPGGGIWVERAVGPNGVGTAIAVGAPAVVFGAEHFCRGWQEWVCHGSPVKDPLSAEVLGVVTVVEVAERATTDLIPFAVSLGHSIEYLLTESRRYWRQRVVDDYGRAEKRWPLDAVAAIDAAGHLLAANGRWREVEDRLGVDRCSRIREQAMSEFLKSPCSRQEIRVNLPAEETRVVVVNSVQCGNRVAGAVVVLERHRAFATAAARDAKLGPAFEQLIGRDPEFRRVLRIAARAAASEEAVLITGATGTGKELVAAAIHRSSRRANQPFVCVNCAALARELIESELFGYESGAFTGARREGKPGRFELADGGTLFLDEIGELPLDLQAKLLRVLEEGAVFRVGSSRPRPIDVRIVAATNRDLVHALATGAFRSDLFYRLDVIELELPPLRTRGADILELTHSFIETMCRQSGRAPLRLTPEAEELLLGYSWPGNVRELRNVVARLVTLVDDDVATVEDLPETLHSKSEVVSPLPKSSLQTIENDLIRRAVETHAGNISEAARHLGIDRSTIYRRLRRLRSP